MNHTPSIRSANWLYLVSMVLFLTIGTLLQDTQTNHPAVKEISVMVTGVEPLAIPAGNFIAWRVRVGNWTVWYDVNAPHTLLKYDAGFATYILTEIREETP